MPVTDVDPVEPLSAEFWRQVEQVRASGPASGLPMSYELAIRTVLRRPLTSVEKLAIVDQARENSPGVRLREDILYGVSRGGLA